MTSDGESFSHAVTSETSDLFIFLVHPYSVIGYLSIFYQESLCERMKYILKYTDTVRLKFHPLIFPVFPSKNTERSHLQLHLETTHCFFFCFCCDSSLCFSYTDWGAISTGVKGHRSPIIVVRPRSTCSYCSVCVQYIYHEKKKKCDGDWNVSVDDEASNQKIYDLFKWVWINLMKPELLGKIKNILTVNGALQTHTERQAVSARTWTCDLLVVRQWWCNMMFVDACVAVGQ